MSIIYDALKKVENALMISGAQKNEAAQKKEAPAPQVKPAPAPVVPIAKTNKTPGSQKLKALLLIIILASIGAYVASNMMKKPQAKVIKNEPPTPLLPPPVKQKEALPQEAPLELIKPVEPADKVKQLQSELVLNGVFFSEGEGYALINNHIVKAKDVIEGATVVRIGQEEVELSYEGVNFKLSTRSR